jgi:5'(3')-deoxyribonucleotidase
MEHDMFRTMEVIEGAADALWRLSDAGVWIRIITHRLYVNWGHEKAVGDTAAWLDANRIPYRDLCFLGAKPEADADAYIDDAPHNVEQLRALGNTTIVFDQPYNRSLDGPRASSWVEVEAIVADLVSANVGRYEPQLPGIDAGSDRLGHRQLPPG